MLFWPPFVVPPAPDVRGRGRVGVAETRPRGHGRRVVVGRRRRGRPAGRARRCGCRCGCPDVRPCASLPRPSRPRPRPRLAVATSGRAVGSAAPLDGHVFWSPYPVPVPAVAGGCHRRVGIVTVRPLRHRVGALSPASSRRWCGAGIRVCCRIGGAVTLPAQPAVGLSPRSPAAERPGPGGDPPPCVLGEPCALGRRPRRLGRRCTAGPRRPVPAGHEAFLPSWD